MMKNRLCLCIFLFAHLAGLVGFVSTVFGGEHISQREYSTLQQAYRLMEQEQYQESLASLEKLLKKKKPSSYALSYTAMCYSNLGKYKKAIQVLERAVTIYPGKNDFWYNIGVLQMQAEEFTGAVHSFRTLLRLSQEKEEVVRYNLAFALYRLEKYKEALVALMPITKVRKEGKGDKGKKVKKHWLLLKTYCEVSLSKWDAAERTGLHILSLDPNSVSTWSLLSRIAVNRQDYTGAAAYLEIANILAPGQKADHLLGRLYGVQSAWNEGAKYYRLEGKSHYIIAQQLAASCQYQQAVDELAKVPGELDIEAAYLRGQLLFVLGSTKKAVEQLLQLEDLPFNLSRLSPAKDKGAGGEKQKRQKRDRLAARSLLLAGQILWLDHSWLKARDVFKKLELQSGYEELGKNLAQCMQGLLMEKETVFEQPGLYDPPL